MVSFSCESCGDVLTKKKLDPHRNRCRGATFTCIDCMVHFPGTAYRSHTSCMTEDQKYQGALYKNKKAKTQESPKTSEPNAMAHAAYVEDAADDYDWKPHSAVSDNGSSPAEPPPEAPTPPPADGGPVNVFDFLVNPTPTASNLSLPQTQTTRHPPVKLSEDTQLVRFEYDAEAYLDSVDPLDDGALVQYGTGPVPTSQFMTPAPKGERKKAKDGGDSKELKKDKKRKRLHLDIHDQEMTDAPPVLHSGLTGGLSKLMTAGPSVFPPSPPDYSGGDAADTPTSPLKKTKHAKHAKPSRAEAIGNSLMAMISSSSSSSKPAKTKKRKHTSSSSSGSSSKKHGHHRHRHGSHSSHHRGGLDAPKEPKLLEYRPGSKDGKDGGSKEGGTMVLYKPPAEHFLSFVNKGPESERGCSMNKALKRYHRERSASGHAAQSKVMEEKELFRSLRLKKNDRGEIVLFSV